MLGLGQVAAEHVQVRVEAGVLLTGVIWAVHSTVCVMDRLWWGGRLVFGDIFRVWSQFVYKHGLFVWLCVLAGIMKLIGIIIVGIVLWW